MSDAKARGRDEVKKLIEEAFRKEFPRDTVDISDGYMDNIHVLVVSRRFDTMDETTKQDMLWTLINGSGLTESERSLISLVLPLSPAEIK